MKKDGMLENEKAVLARKHQPAAFVMNSLRNHRQRQNAKPEEKAHQFPIIASYNVHKCVGRDRKFDPDRTSRVIQEIGADIIALQEADSRFGERTACSISPGWNGKAGWCCPVQSGVKAHGWHGNVVLFREGAVRDVHTLKLPGLEPRGALVVELDLKKRQRAACHRCPFRSSAALPRPAGESLARPSGSTRRMPHHPSRRSQ